jgi:hypothetical protein
MNSGSLATMLTHCSLLSAALKTRNLSFSFCLASFYSSLVFGLLSSCKSCYEVFLAATATLPLLDSLSAVS